MICTPSKIRIARFRGALAAVVEVVCALTATLKRIMLTDTISAERVVEFFVADSFALSNNPALALILHVSRGRLRHVASEIPIDNSQGEIDSRREPAGGGDPIAFDKSQT